MLNENERKSQEGSITSLKLGEVSTRAFNTTRVQGYIQSKYIQSHFWDTK